jgi:hypothetical protein
LGRAGSEERGAVATLCTVGYSRCVVYKGIHITVIRRRAADIGNSIITAALAIAYYPV